MKWLSMGFILLAGLGVISSCTEDSVTTGEDAIAPSTEVLYPISTIDDRLDIADSTYVYVKAKDEVRLSRVEIWASPESEDPAEAIAVLTEPLPMSQVPDSLQQDDGSAVYVTHWMTGDIPNFTVVRLFSRAYDEAGNSTRSDLMVLRIMNEGVPRRPPNPDFTWTPSRGTVEDVFVFDASLSTDDGGPDEPISVRWDFDGDGIWDLDWSPTLLSTTPVEHKYSLARVYTVRLEAHNSYLPNRTNIKERSIEVTNVGGRLDPPEPLEMTLIPAGAYPVGTADTTLAFADEDEYPLHQAVLTVGFYIRRTEVPNRLYVEFLKKEMEQGDPRVRYESNNIWYYPDRVEPVEPDSIPRKIVDLPLSAMYWDPDSTAVVVDPADAEHPVVGVNYYGAKAYAEHYGMRLPTEHEWEIAAKGAMVDYLYPWGTTITGSQANYNNLQSPPGRVLPIGSYPNWPSPFGMLDMSGNVKEWTKDWYGPYEPGQIVNPPGPIFGTLRVVRGGSFLTTAAGVRVTAREATDPSITSSQLGFRTAFTDTLDTR
jgi:formylglycine-generating enzyme required for sulfatase activity